MKRVILLLLLTLISVISSYAQVGYFKNNSTTRIVLRLQQGTCQKRDNGSYIFIPIPPAKPGVPKTPAMHLVISVNIRSLYTYGLLDGYTLYIICEGKIIHQTLISTAEPEIFLPVDLLGNCLLFFVDEKNDACYFGEILNGTFQVINPDSLPVSTIENQQLIDWNTILYNHAVVTDGGELTINSFVVGYPNVGLTIKGSGKLIIDGGTLNNVGIKLQDNASLIIRNGGSVILNKLNNFSSPPGTSILFENGGSIVSY